MYVDDPSELDPVLVPIRTSSRWSRQVICEELHSRRRQGCRDQLQDIDITLARIVEAGHIDEEYALSVEGEPISGAGFGSTTFRVSSNLGIVTAAHIDELESVLELT